MESPQPPVRRGLVDAVGRSPLLLGVALGLLLGDATAASIHVPPAPVVFGVGGLASLLLLAANPFWKRVGSVLVACALQHLLAASVYRPIFPPDHVARAPTHRWLRLDAVLQADPEINPESVRLWLNAEQIDDGDGWRPARGQVLLTVRHMEQTWSAGDRFRARVSLRRPRNFGNPGEFDAEGYWARRGVYVTAYADSDAGFDRGEHVERTGTEWLATWRRNVGALFHRTLLEPQSTVLSALIIGTDSALPRPLRAAFNRAGVSHVLSISGLHVALVAAAGYAIFRWLLARSRWLLLTTNVPKLAAALSAVPVLLYAGIAGSNVATTRSVIMIVVFVAAVVVDRQRHLLVSLAFAAAVVLLTSPGAVLDISFQLSFVAVLGLVLAMERFWPWWKRWEETRLVRLRGWRGRLWRPLAAYAAVSVSALAATTPLTAFHFNQISFVAPFANALVVPLLGSVAVALGLLAAMLYAVSEPLARLCVLVAGPFVWLGVWLVEAFATLPYAAVRVVTPSALELVLLYAGLWAVVRLAGRPRVIALACLSVVGIADSVAWSIDRYHRSDMRVTFLSVGQGDSAVVEFPGSEVMVVDGGGVGGDTFDVGERIVAPFLWSRKIGHVDYLVLSHPDWDHYGGFLFLAQHFSPREFWSNGTAASSGRFTQLIDALHENGVECLALHRGDRRLLGAVDATVASPPQRLDGLSVNNQSLVFSLRLGGTRLLFPGDIEAAAETDMVTRGAGGLASAVLKVPHHGSHTSSSARFLDAVAPQLAVVSAGFENRFGFPHPDVVRRYAAHRCALARTDLQGAVEVRVSMQGAVETRTSRGVSPRLSAPRIAVDSVAHGG